MTNKKRDWRCKGVNKRGEPCGAAATEGGLCFFHANPDKASQLGRIGGRKKRHVILEAGAGLPKSETGIAVPETIDRIVEDVYSDKLDAKKASVIGQLLNVKLRAKQVEATMDECKWELSLDGLTMPPAEPPRPNRRPDNPEDDPQTNGKVLDPAMAEALKVLDPAVVNALKAHGIEVPPVCRPKPAPKGKEPENASQINKKTNGKVLDPAMAEALKAYGE